MDLQSWPSTSRLPNCSRIWRSTFLGGQWRRWSSTIWKWRSTIAKISSLFPGTTCRRAEIECQFSTNACTISTSPAASASMMKENNLFTLTFSPTLPIESSPALTSLTSRLPSNLLSLRLPYGEPSPTKTQQQLVHFARRLSSSKPHGVMKDQDIYWIGLPLK